MEREVYERSSSKGEQKYKEDKKSYISFISEFERRIDPLAFPMEAAWMQYEPITWEQRELKELFLNAKAKGRLHLFTCMTIDPSIDLNTGKLIYKKGLPPAVGYSFEQWVSIFKEYAPSRNSRHMARTEQACENLALIGRLVEEKKWSIEKAWYVVCDDSGEIGNYFGNSDDFEPTGSREICGFYDRGNAYKIIAEDPGVKVKGYLIASGSFINGSGKYPVAAIKHFSDTSCIHRYGVSKLAMD